LYDFEPLENGDLAFSRGDIMEIISREDGNWWKARNVVTNQEGMIPSTYVVPDDGGDQLESQQWWFAVDRQEAETLLMLPINPRGTFLIRPSRDGKSNVLSIRNFDQSTADLDIKHYRIKYVNDQYFIVRKQRFNTLPQLVQHYKKSADNLCHRLVEVCPRQPELVPFKHLEVDRNEIKLDCKLGSGKFGEVWKGKWRNRLEVAVKKLTPGRMTPEEFLKEAETLHKLRHRRLVLLMGVCTISEPMYIVMELMPNGSLSKYLSQPDRGHLLKYFQLVDIAAQIAEGMAFVESKYHVHRDLRAANILVGENTSVKIADLGLARILVDDEYNPHSSAGNFPVKWTAPEAANDQRFTIKSDVWSFGVLLYEIVTYGRVPYIGMSNRETLDKIEAGYRLPNPTNKTHIYCEPILYDKMLECWNAEPSERPSFAALESFLTEYSLKLQMPYALEDDIDEQEAEETQD
jgi:hypothetical protein